MSRCFAYPPPGYERTGINVEEGLVESIKLQKEREKAKKEKRKERKREKKEKKEKSRESRKDKEEKNNSGDKRHNDDRSKLNHYVDTKPTAAEQLERSGLTEEHEQPARVCNGGGGSDDSSDSTQNSNCKRKKPEPPTNITQHGNSHPVHASVLRIRLPLAKHRDHEPPRNEQDPSCSYSFCKFSDVAVGPSLSAEEQHRREQPRQRNDEVAVGPSRSAEYKTPPVKTNADLFRELVTNWTPPELQTENPDAKDMEWLFKRKERHPCKLETKRSRLGENSICQEAAGVLGAPRACYLPEVDIYALPYVLPF